MRGLQAEQEPFTQFVLSHAWKIPKPFLCLFEIHRVSLKTLLLPDPDHLHLLTAFCSQMETADGRRAHDPLSDERGWTVFIFSTLHMLLIGVQLLYTAGCFVLQQSDSAVHIYFLLNLLPI